MKTQDIKTIAVMILFVIIVILTGCSKHLIIQQADNLCRESGGIHNISFIEQSDVVVKCKERGLYQITVD